MNIEQVCKDAIAVVERYIANDVPAYIMSDELYEAREAVNRAWHACDAAKDIRVCRAAWHACDVAKNDELLVAKMFVNAFWEQMS
tara:strand:+ start:616 stop:870 length:255 start_codon:yes stop_codon:yes gene_type:complete